MGDEVPVQPGTAAPPRPTPNALRLGAAQWSIVGAIVLLFAIVAPLAWERIERFAPGADYRLPYRLSEDYWLYDRFMRHVAGPGRIVLLGDSVVWGEYVLPNGTLSHFLNRATGGRERFVNGGVNGIFPLAMEGLVRYHARALRRARVIVPCNMLWMTSPRTDLSADEDGQFNHTRLVPQFSPRIPSYKAGLNDRLGVLVRRHVELMGWVAHLQGACFAQKSIAEWMMEDDGDTPPHYPNAWTNPLAQIISQLNAAPAAEDTRTRGPSSPRHRPWSDEGATPVTFDWVDMDSSLQWGAFRRVIDALRQRGNDVYVVVGPFNEAMIAPDSRPGYERLRRGIDDWLTRNGVSHAVPDPLPGPLCADASHPLTQGYELLANRLLRVPSFAEFIRER